MLIFYLCLEETYDRVMKYGDEQVNVKIHINDVENMVRDNQSYSHVLFWLIVMRKKIGRGSTTHSRHITLE